MISFSNAKRILEPHLDAFYQIPHNAWAEYMDIPEGKRIKFCNRTRASVIHNFMIFGLTDYASSIADIKVFNLKKLYLLLIDNLAIRFKKFDESNLSSNQLTNQVRCFRNQRPLDGIPTICNLEVGYSLDRYEKSISQVTIACPSGIKNNLWEVELTSTKKTELVIDLFHTEYKEDVQPVIFKPKKKAEVIPIIKIAGGNRESDNDKNN